MTRTRPERGHHPRRQVASRSYAPGLPAANGWLVSRGWSVQSSGHHDEDVCGHGGVYGDPSLPCHARGVALKHVFRSGAPRRRCACLGIRGTATRCAGGLVLIRCN
jgi:hypothetical protein